MDMRNREYALLLIEYGSSNVITVLLADERTDRDTARGIYHLQML